MRHTKILSWLLSIVLLLALASTAYATEEALPDASDYVEAIENATIDPALYLDYSAGIEAGVYRWILSDDGSYYTLTAVNEEGEAETTVEAELNVDANNEETVDTGNASASGEMRRGSGEASGGAVPGSGRGLSPRLEHGPRLQRGIFHRHLHRLGQRDLR